MPPNSLGNIAASTDETPTPQYRPRYHFTPQRFWMNDPNGMVFHDGIYHLFYQYHPEGITWGPMHWGHASSRDLLTWHEHAIALAPDALGTIFSGSVVIDHDNTSGLASEGEAPWIALFTQHDAAADSAGSNAFQVQSLASSTDHGASWSMYPGNPVLQNSGHRDFRDPKVFWHAPSSRWVMSIAIGDRIAFHSSANLKDWTWLSEFGAGIGAHDGIWECPDLFSMNLDGEEYWVLVVSLVKGAPNGGSGTQYFLGRFDGCEFTSNDAQTRWLDYGPDNYAGVTWHNTDERRVFIGWMSNWAYAKDMPTNPWRGSMSLPRDLVLSRVDGLPCVTSRPALEIATRIATAPGVDLTVENGSLEMDRFVTDAQCCFSFEFTAPVLQDFTLTLSNTLGEALHIGYQQEKNRYFVDRRTAGPGEFNPVFAGEFFSPRLANKLEARVTLIVDTTSVELFADEGLTTMSCLFFPSTPFTRMSLTSNAEMLAGSVQLRRLDLPI